MGFVAVGPDQDSTVASAIGWLHAIYLRPDQWGRGIGGTTTQCCPGSPELPWFHARHAYGF
ncbi:MAG: hypothetical protein ACRDR6_18195 [Pseudonocardiaceae bacterium]